MGKFSYIQLVAEGLKSKICVAVPTKQYSFLLINNRGKVNNKTINGYKICKRRNGVGNFPWHDNEGFLPCTFSLLKLLMTRKEKKYHLLFSNYMYNAAMLQNYPFF